MTAPAAASYTSPMANTTLGLPENLEAVLCYLFGFVSGFLFYVVEKENQFVRFHALQSLSTFLALFIVGLILHRIPIIGFLLAWLLAPASFCLWLLLMYKALLGQRYCLPVVGPFVEKHLGA